MPARVNSVRLSAGYVTNHYGTILAWFFLAMVLYASVFQLPFAFPPSVPTFSASYEAGFNNRVASAAVAVFSVIAFMAAFARQKLQPAITASNMPVWLLLVALVVQITFLSGLAACVLSSPHNYGEATYMLDRLDQVDLFGRVPFRDFEFAYGPLMLYGPVFVKHVLSPLQVSLECAYYISLIGMTALGLVLLFWVIDTLIPRRSYKIAVFVLFATCLNTTMGMNYTFFRFIGPYAAILFVTRFKKVSTVAFLLFLAGLAELGISPEIGLAFMVGASFYCLCRAVQGGRLWIVGVVTPWIGCAVIVLIFGSGYFRVVQSFSSGFNNFVIVPVPHILIYLAAAVFIVPMGVAAAARRGTSKDLAVVALWTVSVALIPSALGRCDSGHVILAGLGIFLLSFAFQSTRPRLLRNTWIGLVSAVILMQAVNGYRFYARPMLSSAGSGIRAYFPPGIANSVFARLQMLSPRLEELTKGPQSRQLDFAEDLIAAVGQASVAAPFGIDKQALKLLKSADKYRPEFFAGLVNVSDARSEDIKIKDLRGAKWAIVPHDLSLGSQDLAFVRRVFAWPVSYPRKREQYISGSRVRCVLETTWIYVRSVGNGEYLLYRNPSFQ
ncbi:MAG: hypothetical protein M3Z09_01765 [Acidobacteriota bacterium]|nr:hypothetical protein [Acidobacteriota bacterium]